MENGVSLKIWMEIDYEYKVIRIEPNFVAD